MTKKKVSDRLINYIDRIGKYRTIVLSLAVVVVFITTYLLILPAFTLDKDEAEKQGGIDLPATEVSVDADTEEEAAADDQPYVAGDNKETTQAVENDEKKPSDAAAESSAEETTDPLKFEGENYSISVVDNEGVLPDGTQINVEEIDTKENTEEKKDFYYEDYYKEALSAIKKEEGGVKVRDLAFAHFYDISLMSGDKEIQPEDGDTVNVKIEYEKDLSKELKVEDADKLKIVHFTKDEETGELIAEVLDAEEKNVLVDTDRKDKLQSAEFDADSFSVYAVVYTVDFKWEVDGEEYEYSLDGGGFISLKALIEILKVDDDPKSFVEDIETTEFSDPELVWVGKAEEATTVGSLKEANELDCEYSSQLTEDEITEINEQPVDAGDWALISLKPFDTEEALTITMKNGDQFVIKVTDAQDPSVYVGKEVIIYDNNEKRAMTSNWSWDNYRNQCASIPYSGAENNSSAHWTIESANGGYYIRSSDGRYLRLNGTDQYALTLVNNVSEATVLTIRAGSNPDYQIYAANNNSSILTYSDNSQYDGFFSGPGGTNGNTQTWLYIEEVQSSTASGGDWMLYFDDDFSEITIHVGDTITLRPYNKWEWKEGNVDVQTAHWNVGGNSWNDWTITSSDASGSRYGTTTDGPFQFTRFVKEDGQLNTHYWSVQGRATQTGVYYLTNTKDPTKRIKVNVVEGDPVSKPNTISNIANIKVNLFDYDKNGLLDPANDTNLANNSNNKNDSVNQMGGSNHFYFLSSGSGNNNNEPWNNYTQDASNPNIVKSTLGIDGYPELNHGNSNTSLKYLFDESQTSWHGGNNSDGMIAYPNVVGMFQKDNNGYYYFNSNTNYFFYDTSTGTSKLYEHTYTQVSKSDGSVNDKPIGFFPFRDYGTTDDLYVNQNSALNHHLGMSMDIEFMLSNDRKDDNGQPIIFDFSGDDDLWVFVEWVDDNGVKNSQLLLDLGGVHQPIHGDINFTSGSNTQFIEPNKPYTLKVFYLERGGCDSNCSIRFNLPIVQDLAVAKKLTGLTEEEKVKYKDEEFEYEILVNGEPYDSDSRVNKYEKVTIWNAAGEDVTPDDFKIVNGRFKLKDGQTLTISYLDRSDKFTVAELNTSNMENFEVPNAERYYHKKTDASLYEEEIALTASQTQSTPITADWVTPQYTLEDTEKVTFTNTLKEKNLEVEKKWAGNKAHPDSITFTVSATVDDGTGGRTPYTVSELKESDGTTDKVFTLNSANDWRYTIEHLPVNTPDGKFIFYEINEGHVEGYVLTGSIDLTAEHYNYCNVDVVKLWPDSNGEHTEEIRVVLKNSADKYYAGKNSQGEAIFVDNISDADTFDLTKDNNYTHRFERVPAGEYTAEQLNQDDYSKGLSTYVRNIIQYELENTPMEEQADPTDKPNTPKIHKRIDALRDGITNPDSAHAGEDLTDLYRLYLDYKIDALQDSNGVDLLFVIDHSGSMNDSHWPGNEYRAPAVISALNGQDGLISKFLSANDKNRWAAVGFKGPDGFRDYTFDLGNPWQPSTDKSRINAGQNGSEVLSPGGTSYEFTRSAGNISLANEGPLIQSNYTAGFWRAEQFLLDQDVKNDGRKKVVVFISDGVPTLHIDGLNGSLTNAGTAAGSPYYREEYGGCPDKALTEFGYFVNDMTGNGYVFGDNIEFYTIGLGASMQTAGGAGLLNGMLGEAYGQEVPDNHYMTITDASGSSDSSAANKLDQDLRIVLGLNHTFSNLVIKDNLSEYVDLYGLAEAGSSASAIMTAAKAKVTMTVPDPDDPEAEPQVITLYENGAPATAENAKFTNSDGDKVPIIQELQYNASTKTVSAVFDPEYQPAGDVTYTLSFDVKATDTAYTTYAAGGYDSVGDEDTDFLGTDPANATSVGKAGFHSNDSANATYKDNSEEKNLVYKHPVIQVTAKADIVKVDQTGAALEGATFNLYDDTYDPNKTIEENEGSLIEADLQSKKPIDPPGNDAVIRSGKLSEGTYYLVETVTPAGYNTLSGPVIITVTETNGIIQMTAEIEGEPAGDNLVKVSDGVWKLSIPNSSGYELPHSGGIGTTLFYIFGSILLITGAIYFVARKRINS